jgi:hypothetical protein
MTITQSALHATKSKFGFWLITSILTAFATVGFAFFQSYFAARQARLTQSAQLDLEVEYRLSQYMTGLARIQSDLSAKADQRVGYTGEDIKALTETLIGIPKAVKDIPIYSMFPKEFGARPLASLLAEKAWLHPDKAAVFKNQIASVSGDDFHMSEKFTDVVSLAKHVNRVLFPENAKGEFFYYTDCPSQSPLC